MQGIGRVLDLWVFDSRGHWWTFRVEGVLSVKGIGGFLPVVSEQTRQRRKRPFEEETVDRYLHTYPWVLLS